jgi:hypothetical protein
LLKELSLLHDVFIANGYPLKLVRKTIDESWASEFRKTLEKITETEQIKSPKEFFDVIHAPYVQGFSEKVQRALRKFNVGYVPKKGKTVFDQLCHMKCPRTVEEKKDVVYMIMCKTCDKRYIGETSQKFQERKKQHRRDVSLGKETNGIFCHILQNSNHEIEWEKPLFLDEESFTLKRKIKESLYIRALNNGGCDKLMNIDKGRDIHESWDRFYPWIQRTLLKKSS